MPAENASASAETAISGLVAFLTERSIAFETSAVVGSFSWLKSSAICDCVVTPQTAEALVAVLNYCISHGIPHKVLGNTSNCFFPSEEHYSCLIRTTRLNSFAIDWERQELTAECGASLSSLALKTANLGVAGFAGMVGIPGTVGGAIFMNAGSYGDTIGDSLKCIEFIDDVGRCRIVEKNELDLGYRTSALRKGSLGGTVLRAFFNAQSGSPAELQRRVAIARTQRNTTQEKQLPNLGSLFATQFIYADIAKHHFLYRILLSLYFSIFFRGCRWILRWTPPPSYLNALTLFWFGKAFPVQPFSDFTMNCYVRRSNDDAVFHEYVEWVRALTKDTIELENEIVRESIQ